MANPRAFLTIHRQEAGYRPVEDRIDDFSEVEQHSTAATVAARHPVAWIAAYLSATGHAPSATNNPNGRTSSTKGNGKRLTRYWNRPATFRNSPAASVPPFAEKSCVLKLSCDEPVTIRENEAAIVEAAFREGYIQPQQPRRNGKHVAVVGSGPAGLTAANQLNRKGYEVTVFEKDELPGGLLRFGIPNFKLGKNIHRPPYPPDGERRIKFRVNTMVGKEVTARDIVKDFDAVCIAIGSEIPRDLPIEGRNLKGVHFALELLGQQNRLLEGIAIPP